MVLTVTGLVFTGLYTATTFIAVLLQDISGIPQAAIAGVLLLFGLGSIVGNVLGGLATDRFGVQRSVLASGLGIGLGLVGLAWLGPVPIGAISACAILGVSAGILVPSQQTRLVSLAPAAPDFGLAMNLAALNLGIACGAALGSSLVDHTGVQALGYVGAMIVAVAVAVDLRRFRLSRE